VTRRAVIVREAIVLIIATLVAGAVAPGCAQRQPTAPPPRAAIKPPDPWFGAKSFCVLPLSRPEIPPTGDLLARSIVDAWRATTLKFPDPAKVVTIVGGRYPAVDTLRVDLSDSQLVEGKKRASIGDPRPTSRGLLVRHFALVAEPARARGATMNMQLTGEDVRFELQRDKDRRPLLMMTDAASGTVHFDAATADLEKVMLASARENSGSRGIYVRSLQLKFTSRGPRALDAELYVKTLVGFVPAGIRFSARVDVDEKMNARVHHLDVEGDEIFGPLISAFIRPGLAKYEGKTKPLIGFPNEAVRLTDVRIKAGDRVTMDAVFRR
jgi:hypothetical protein